MHRCSSILFCCKVALTGAHAVLSDRWGLGNDESPVRVRQPSKALSMQMSITPLPLQRHLTDAHAFLFDRWGLGDDESPVKVRQPPKALSVQMAITPLPLQRHPDAVGTAALAGESAGLYWSSIRAVSQYRQSLAAVMSIGPQSGRQGCSSQSVLYTCHIVTWSPSFCCLCSSGPQSVSRYCQSRTLKERDCYPNFQPQGPT